MYLSPHTIQRLKRIQALLDQLNPEDEPQALLVPGSPSPHANIIVFPGSFNPPTNAHIALLQQARLFAHDYEPASLYAAISKRTVDKEKVERPTLLDRIDLLNTMLRRRLRDTGIIVFNRGLYVEQAQAIRTSFPNVQRIFFLLGFDKIVQIFDPHYYEDRTASLVALFNLAELLVAPRGNDGEKELHALIHRPENERFAQYVHPLTFGMQYRNMSSTRIRQGDAALHDVPSEVQQFMRETHAYELPFQQSDGTVIDYYEERVKAMHVLLSM
ncbi:MAG: hypothetical protein NVS4B12_16700 [Ktedonobacteraceae bacterium]